MKKVLVVEDDQMLLGMYQKILTKHGYQVKTATDGETGLRLALADHPDLILLDIRMPKMDGMTVLHHLRADKWGKRVLVIILTNLDMNDERLAAITIDQPSYYLIKADNPPKQVLEKINKVLDN